MCQITIEQQLQALKEGREKFLGTRAGARKFLQDAGIIKPRKKYTIKKKKK